MVIGMWIMNIRNKMFQRLTILLFVTNFQEIFIHAKFNLSEKIFEHIN